MLRPTRLQVARTVPVFAAAWPGALSKRSENEEHIAVKTLVLSTWVGGRKGASGLVSPSIPRHNLSIDRGELGHDQYDPESCLLGVFVAILIGLIRTRRTKNYDVSTSEVHPDLEASEDLLRDVMPEASRLVKRHANSDDAEHS
jgi:hypothetical protein